MHEVSHKRSLAAFGTVVAACLTLSSVTVEAQRPAVDASLIARARSACDAAAMHAGYNVLRRDTETHTTTTYAFPLHVRHGTEEADVTCTYDTHRGAATLSELRAAQREERAAARTETREARAQRLCRDFVNSKRGYRVETVGDPVARGAMYDVPIRVRRNGRSNVEVTCRFNSANNKLSMR